MKEVEFNNPQVTRTIERLNKFAYEKLRAKEIEENKIKNFYESLPKDVAGLKKLIEYYEGSCLCGHFEFCDTCSAEGRKETKADEETSVIAIEVLEKKHNIVTIQWYDGFGSLRFRKTKYFDKKETEEIKKIRDKLSKEKLLRQKELERIREEIFLENERKEKEEYKRLHEKYGNGKLI